MDMEYVFSLIPFVLVPVALAEFVLFWKASPLLFWQAVIPASNASMPDDQPDGLAGQSGGSKSLWWTCNDEGVLRFRRRIGFGRRAMIMGTVRWTDDGAAVRWAPWPALSWIVLFGMLAIAMLAGAVIDGTTLQGIGFMVLYGALGVALVFGFNWGMSWYFFKQHGLPELAMCLLEWEESRAR